MRPGDLMDANADHTTYDSIDPPRDVLVGYHVGQRRSAAFVAATHRMFTLVVTKDNVGWVVNGWFREVG